MNKNHYIHLIIYTLTFALLLGLSLWMYTNYKDRSMQEMPNQEQIRKEAADSVRVEINLTEAEMESARDSVR